MSTHKHIDKICLVAVIVSFLFCIAFMNGEVLGIQAASRVMGYENRLFDTSRVHTIDIVMDDWDTFLTTARNEEYSVCSVVIDGEAVTNVGIRGKGNTSLSSVASMDSDRYSFKIEFDQYDSAKTYYGLDKLSLNNVIQDNTYMKDYLAYQMMGEFGAAAPLCSYAWLTVNGEDWGLYLAVEAVEESFLQRNYGNGYGELYKPDGMNMGGGRGNGKDFEMPDFSQWQGNTNAAAPDETAADRTQGGRGNGMMRPGGAENSTENTGWPSIPEGMQMPAAGSGMPQFPGMSGDTMQIPNAEAENALRPNGGGFGGFGGMGSSDVKLQYIDDDPNSYSAIFDSAKTDITQADQTRLIASLKQLSQYENLPEVVNVDDVLRYFVVHNYVVNGDSYTGNMIHNYYLYEENGQLSMIPWDYNLAFGTFMGGGGASSVNDDIDKVLSDRPMQAWIFSDEAYSNQYYDLYAQLLEQVNVQGIIDNAYRLIAPYVEKDPTAFCTYEEFETGVNTLKEFCRLRSESVRLQLAGSAETVDAGDLNLSDMGTMGGGRGGPGNFEGAERGNQNEGMQKPEAEAMGGSVMPLAGSVESKENPWGNMRIPTGAEMPGNRTDRINAAGEAAGGQNMPAGGSFGGFSPPGGGQDFGNMGSMGNRPAGAQQTDSSQMTAILLIVSVLTLAAGLVIAGKFRR